VAYQDHVDVAASFEELAAMLLRRGLAPAFGTHDVALLQRLERAAGELLVGRAGYEVQMLYGIRADEQRRLAAGGRRVRVLIAYGTEWFAWYLRRLAERPANLLFVLAPATASRRSG
jgi:proline dehydrogenase